MAASILGTMSTGLQQLGQRLVIAGQEKSGKTTLACQAPGAILIPAEMGFQSMPVAKTRKLESWSDLQQVVSEIEAAIKKGQIKQGQTIVFDSATAIERFAWAQTIVMDPKHKSQKLTMETAHGAYGKAYAVATDLFNGFLNKMDEFAFYGRVNVVLTCHVFASRVIDPVAGEFDTWDLLLHSPKNAKTYGARELVTQWADFIGFLYEPVTVLAQEEGQKIQRAVSLNKGRVLGVARTPGYVAGNRYQMQSELSIPLNAGWNVLAGEIYQKSPGQVNLWNYQLEGNK